jgi:hypothetical protein
MFFEQSGKCAACQDLLPGIARAALDHCHETGHERALLCGACNTALGLVREDPARLVGLLEYIERVCVPTRRRRDSDLGWESPAPLHVPRPVPYYDHMPNAPKPHTNDTAATMPPGPADAAALEHGRRLVSTGTDRSAAFWAAVERLARETGVTP